MKIFEYGKKKFHIFEVKIKGLRKSLTRLE